MQGIAILESRPKPTEDGRHVSAVLVDGPDMCHYEMGYFNMLAGSEPRHAHYNHGLYWDLSPQEFRILEATLWCMAGWPPTFTLLKYTPPMPKDIAHSLSTMIDGLHPETPLIMNCVTAPAAALNYSDINSPFFDSQTIRYPHEVADTAISLSPTPSLEWKRVNGGLAWNCRVYGVGYQAVTEGLQEALAAQKATNNVVMTLEM